MFVFLVIRRKFHIFIVIQIREAAAMRGVSLLAVGVTRQLILQNMARYARPGHLSLLLAWPSLMRSRLNHL